MYGGLLLAAVGFAAASGDELRMLMALLFFLVLDTKVGTLCPGLLPLARAALPLPREAATGCISPTSPTSLFMCPLPTCQCTHLLLRLQATLEEGFLTERFGEEYKQLQEKTKKFIPLVY